MSPVLYINNMGGTNSLEMNKLAGTIWQCCIDRDIFVSTSHLSGSENLSPVFSSPEHEVLKVRYCDRSLSVVRLSGVNFCFKRLLLQNCWTDFEILSQKCSLGDSLPKLLKRFRSAEQYDCQS